MKPPKQTRFERSKTMSELNAQPIPEQKKKSGCAKGCAVGCVTVILLAVAAGILLYVGGSKLLMKLAEEYTSTAPASLPTVECSQQEASDLIARVDAFSQALKEGKHGQELPLSARDINVLILKKPGLSDLAGKLYVNIDGERIHGEASIPLEKLGSSFKGRWLNSSGTFRVETAAGRLLVFMDKLSVRGKPLPEPFMAGIRSKNLAEDASKNPKTVEALAKIDSVSVRDGKLRIVSK
jgi:hypothetical protein